MLTFSMFDLLYFFFFVRTVGGPADGRLLPGDQVLKVNNKAIDDLSPEYVDNMIR